MDDTAERIARNDAAFRAANNRIDAAAQDVLDVAPFLCECADPTCTELIELALEEYEEIRRNPRHFINSPGHERAAQGWAVVVKTRGSYVIVEKIGEAGLVAEELEGRDA